MRAPHPRPQSRWRLRFAAVVLPLALAGCGGEGAESPAPPAATSPSPALSSAPWFQDATAAAGLDFVQEAGDDGHYYLVEIMGGGVAFFDADGDGDLDLYATNGHRGLPEPARVSAPKNHYWRQEAGGRFVDATETAGLGDGGYGQGVTIGDVDNDGDEDVYLANYGEDRLLLNDGTGQFTDVTAESGLSVGGWSTSSGFFDADNDGDLDLYVARYAVMDPKRVCYSGTGQQDYCSPKSYKAVADVLLRNEGGGRFTDVSESSGIAGFRATGLGVSFDDANDDGLMDVYVANDGYPNNLWINRGDWTFVDEALSMGVAYNNIGQAEAGMGVLHADLNGDAELDIFLTHLVGESNTYYRSRGPSRGYVDDSKKSGLGGASMDRTGFGTVALDLELDGDLDLLVANGRVQRTATPLEGSSLREPWRSLAEQNQAYLNDGKGSFRPGNEEVGSFSRELEVSRGLAIGDFDRDGDMDLVLGNVAGPIHLYRNVAPRRGRWLTVRPVEPALKRVALNARVLLRCGESELVRTVAAAGSYLSSNEAVAHFGLAGCEAVDGVEVRWPDGGRERFPAPALDQSLELRRGEGEVVR